MKCVVLIFFIIVFLITVVPAAQGGGGQNYWPAGKPNKCEPDWLFIDFESGIDRIPIENTIPSLTFTMNSTLFEGPLPFPAYYWRYGDIRTNAYDVYPYLGKSYEVNGNFFARLDNLHAGEIGNSGQINFPGGGATYCSVLVSTASPVQLWAYNSQDELIDSSGWQKANINTRTLSHLWVSAPEGEIIAYVRIQNSANSPTDWINDWIMDDLCTDANKAVMPIPGRSIGSHSDKFDIVFIPDTDYGSSADIETWLPTFLNHINHQIDERLGGAAPVTGNLDKFNFYYTRNQGDTRYLWVPDKLTRMSPFTDAYVFLHNRESGDATVMSTPSIYGAEGPVGRSFIHESGHGIFRLADEYDGCYTNYFQPYKYPNIWATETECRNDATDEGWNPDDCWKFTECQGGWWKLGHTQYIMWDGDFFANGWGPAAERHIQWWLNPFPDSGPLHPVKSIWLNLQVADEFNLLNESFVTDSPPNYLPGKYDFTAKVFSTSGDLLGEYGFNDPRRIIAESGYEGPTWRDSVNSQLILPYFNDGDRVDLIESATGSVKLSVDISQYAVSTNSAPNLVQPGDQTITEGQTMSLNLIATDPENDPLTYTFTPALTGASISENTFTWTPGSGTAGKYPVTFNVTDTGGLFDEESINITVTAPTTNVPITVKIVPKTINLGSKGYFLAFVTLPEAYKGATIDMKTVSCSGAPALRMMKLKFFPRIVGFVFKTSELDGVEVGKKVTLNIKGELRNKGTTYTFTGADSVKVISKPTWQPDDIKDISKVSDDQLFKKFNT